jgi:hypothetical protein
MPYPTEHSARILDPADFIPTSFRSKTIIPGVRIIIGKLKGKTATTVQTYRFSIDKFTATQAKAWLKKNNVKNYTFEEATKTLKHYGVLGMHWGVITKGSSSGGGSAGGYRRSQSGGGSSGGGGRISSLVVRKKLSDMSDAEIKAATKRMQLVIDYKTARFPKSGRKISEMSNSELQSHIDKAALYKAGGKFGFKKMSEINKMSQSHVKAQLTRLNLEKSYRDVQKKQYDGVRKMVTYLMAIKV